MTKKNDVNFNDVVIMHGTTIIHGSSTAKLRPDLSIRDLKPEQKVMYCIPGPTPTSSLSKKAWRFLEHLRKIFRVGPVHRPRHNTVLYIPAPAENPKEKQVQDMNYGSFIHTMAELFTKYAPQILN